MDREIAAKEIMAEALLVRLTSHSGIYMGSKGVLQICTAQCG